jgi:hypothetical protein
MGDPRAIFGMFTEANRIQAQAVAGAIQFGAMPQPLNASDFPPHPVLSSLPPQLIVSDLPHSIVNSIQNPIPQVLGRAPRTQSHQSSIPPRQGIPVRSAGPVENPAVIRNIAGYLQRHRNATVRSCYAPAKAPYREAANKVFTVRTVNDSGTERFCVANMHVGDEPVVAAQIYHDVPRGLAPSELRALPRSTFTASMDAEECIVCFADFEVGENITISQCGHRAHSEPCASQWFAQSTLCPTCREPCGRSVNEVASNRNVPQRPVRSIANSGFMPAASISAEDMRDLNSRISFVGGNPQRISSPRMPPLE